MTVFPAHELESPILETDVAIIGAGPAGLSLAAQLQTDCVVVESGGYELDPRSHHLFRSVNSGEPCNMDSLRVRGIGGASLRWTGRCIPMDEYDFEDRPWISPTTWPVSYDDMKGWFDKAAELMELPDGEALLETRRLSLSNLACQSEFFDQLQWRYADDAKGSYRFGDRLKHAFGTSGKMLLYHAHCAEILANARTVKAVRLVAKDGRSILLKARRFVVASGCVESCRLLLATRLVNGELLDVVSPWLGKGFNQHLRLNAGRVRAGSAALRALQLAIGIQRKRRVNTIETGLGVNRRAARANRLGNASLILRYERDQSAASGNFLPRLKGKISGTTALLNRATAQIEIDSEQTVSKDSYVALADERDPLGMPRAQTHWTISETDCRTAYRVCTQFAELIDKSGLGETAISPGISEQAIAPETRRDSNHQLGGTRMSETPEFGVVDANLKVHGTANMWVVGGSVFPTGGHANPTMTIVALALRLAEHLNEAGIRD